MSRSNATDNVGPPSSNPLPFGSLTDTEMRQPQLDPLPRDLPFRIVSKTVGRGAYASYVRLPLPDEHAQS